MTPAVLLDLDGTLVALAPPKPDLEELRAELLAVAASHRVAIDHRGIFPIYRTLAAAGSGAAEARTLLDRYEVRWANTTATPLVSLDLLTELTARAQVALVTSNGRACVAALRERGLLPAFAAEVTRDDVTDLKPAPEPVTRALTALGPAESAVYLGDTRADADAVAAYARARPPSSAPVTFLPVGEHTGSTTTAQSTHRAVTGLIQGVHA